MATRHRLTQPVDVKLDRARFHLAEGRRQIDDGRPVLALFNVMHAILNLQRARGWLDAQPD